MAHACFEQRYQLCVLMLYRINMIKGKLRWGIIDCMPLFFP